MDRTKIKLCGITLEEDYMLAARLGIDYAGFIFVPGSSRFQSPDKVRLITGGSDSPKKVGIFADQPVDEVLSICRTAGIGIAQLHGNESLAYCESLGMPFWKALTGSEGIEGYADLSESPVLIDASGADRTGGNLSLKLAGNAVASGRRIILAGGLSNANIVEYLELKPWGVDFSSSVEICPGVKEPLRVTELVEKVRGFEYENS
jgi:phosphoribosylanthranilate isomerase